MSKFEQRNQIYIHKWIEIYNWKVVIQSQSHVWLWSHGQQYTRLPHPSLYPAVSSCLFVHSDLCPLSQWCHPTISSSVAPFFSCPHSFPASGSFPTSQLFTSNGQSIGALASRSILPMNIEGWNSIGLTGTPKGLSRVSPAPQLKSINPSALRFLDGPALTFIYDYWEKV